jgi:hypothetical protein
VIGGYISPVRTFGFWHTCGPLPARASWHLTLVVIAHWPDMAPGADQWVSGKAAVQSPLDRLFKAELEIYTVLI